MKALNRAKAFLLQPQGSILTSGPTKASKVVTLPLSRKPLEAGAKLLANILYPRDEQQRLKAQMAIEYEIVKRSVGRKPGHVVTTLKPVHEFAGADHQVISRARAAWEALRSSLPASELRLEPEALQLSDKGRSAAMRRAETQWKHRMAGALMAQALIWRHAKHASGQNPQSELSLFQLLARRHLDLIDSPDPLLLRDLLLRHGPDAGENDPFNAQSRAFSPTFPVLHLAISLECLFSFNEKPALTVKPLATVLEMVQPADFVAGALVLAHGFAQLIAGTPELEEAARRLVCFTAV